MQLDWREDGDRRARVVIWKDGSQTDLGVLVAALIAAAICAGTAFVAANFGGVLRVAGIVLAAVSGVYAAFLLVILAVVRWALGRFDRWLTTNHEDDDALP